MGLHHLHIIHQLALSALAMVMLTSLLLALSCHGDMACVQLPEQSPAPAGDSSWNFPATSKAQAMAQAQVLSTTLGVPVSTDPSKPPPVGSSTNVSAAVTNKVRVHMHVSIYACAVQVYVMHSAPRPLRAVLTRVTTTAATGALGP